MVMDGPFYFNDSSFDMMRIDYVIPVNSVEQWRLVNETMVAHPFHIHDSQFFLLDRSGSVPPLEEQGRKDVVLVGPQDSVQFITKFEDFTDTIIPYMYHCHILMHEDAGMMGQFLVVPPSYQSVPNSLVSTSVISVFPNPATQSIKVNLPSSGRKFDIRIFEMNGNVVISKNDVEANTIDLTSLSNGMYRILIRQDNKYYSSQFIRIDP